MKMLQFRKILPSFCLLIFVIGCGSEEFTSENADEESYEQMIGDNKADSLSMQNCKTSCTVEESLRKTICQAIINEFPWNEIEAITMNEFRTNCFNNTIYSMNTTHIYYKTMTTIVRRDVAVSNQNNTWNVKLLKNSTGTWRAIYLFKDQDEKDRYLTKMANFFEDNGCSFDSSGNTDPTYHRTWKKYSTKVKDILLDSVTPSTILDSAREMSKEYLLIPENEDDDIANITLLASKISFDGEQNLGFYIMGYHEYDRNVGAVHMFFNTEGSDLFEKQKDFNE